MGSTSRDYVESYVKDISQNTEDYLAAQQPNYDASKTTNSIPLPPKSSSSKKETPIEEEPSTTFSFHKSTTNPMASENQQQSHQQQDEEEKGKPKVVWAVRDFADQRREIHDTALVNCSDLHIDLMQCFQHGSWWDKAKMCEEQKQKFWKCFHGQKKFLKAANYKGPISTPEEDDIVLMQAMKFRDEMDNQSNSPTDTSSPSSKSTSSPSATPASPVSA